MNTIGGRMPTQISSQNTSDRTNRMDEQAKAMGAPEEIIAQGQEAVKTWAQENGKMPTSAGSEGIASGKKTIETKSADALLSDLEESGIEYDKFIEALENGPNATKQLFNKHNFSIDFTV